MDCHRLKVDSIKKGVGTVLTFNPKASVITDAGDSHIRGKDYGIYQRRLRGATHQLHCSGRKGLVKELCQPQPQDKIWDQMW